MNFNPKSEGEVQQFNLLPDGIYDFEVMSAKDRVSKKGNEMIELKLGIWQGDKITHYIFDYLLSDDQSAYKLRHCCDTTGLIDKYDSGTLTANMFEARTGKAKIGTQKDKTGQYADKNVVRDYIPRPTKSENALTQTHSAEPLPDMRPVEDDLPF